MRSPSMQQVGGERRRGFGTELIEHVVAYQLHGEADLAFDEAGVRYTMTMPLVPADDGGGGPGDDDGATAHERGGGI